MFLLICSSIIVVREDTCNHEAVFVELHCGHCVLLLSHMGRLLPPGLSVHKTADGEVARVTIKPAADRGPAAELGVRAVGYLVRKVG